MWKPDFDGHQPSQHVLRYANRVASLQRGDTPAGHVLIQSDVKATQLSGHLWWRRWGPLRDVFWVWTVVDGRFSDSYVTEPDRVLEETEMWDRGAFEHDGEVLAATWLPEEDAEETRASVFGV